MIINIIKSGVGNIGSISRVMQSLVDQKTNYLGGRFRRLWSLYQQNEDHQSKF